MNRGWLNSRPSVPTSGPAVHSRWKGPRRLQRWLEGADFLRHIGLRIIMNSRKTQHTLVPVREVCVCVKESERGMGCKVKQGDGVKCSRQKLVLKIYLHWHTLSLSFSFSFILSLSLSFAHLHRFTHSRTHTHSYEAKFICSSVSFPSLDSSFIWISESLFQQNNLFVLTIQGQGHGALLPNLPGVRSNSFGMWSDLDCFRQDTRWNFNPRRSSWTDKKSRTLAKARSNNTAAAPAAAAADWAASAASAAPARSPRTSKWCRVKQAKK